MPGIGSCMQKRGSHSRGEKQLRKRGSSGAEFRGRRGTEHPSSPWNSRQITEYARSPGGRYTYQRTTYPRVLEDLEPQKDGMHICLLGRNRAELTLWWRAPIGPAKQVGEELQETSREHGLKKEAVSKERRWRRVGRPAAPFTCSREQTFCQLVAFVG